MGVLVRKNQAEISEDGGFFSTVKDDAEEWATGRSWLFRVPLLALLVYFVIQHLRDSLYGSWLFGGITLAIHEMGHPLFGFLGQFMSIAGGTILQLIAPTAAGLVLARQRDYFGVAVTGFWLSFSLFNVATYMSDAQEMELPLVSLGAGDPIHDWNFMLTKVGLLAHDGALAGVTRFLAFLVAAASLALGAWLCLIMYRTRDQRRLGTLS